MKSLLIATALTFSLATSAMAETIHVGVNGLVCAFCVQGIESTFKKQAATDTVKVDMDAKLVTIITKPDATMKDALITKLITDSGYTVTSIHHMK